MRNDLNMPLWIAVMAWFISGFGMGVVFKHWHHHSRKRKRVQMFYKVGLAESKTKPQTGGKSVCR